jgi:vanillate/3-O-methylgallate O-demethylase
MLMRDGKMVGMSMFNGYSFNERCMLSLGVVNDDVQIGDQLTLSGASRSRPARPRPSRTSRPRSACSSSPTPYSREARESYAESWRTKSGA